MEGKCDRAQLKVLFREINICIGQRAPEEWNRQRARDRQIQT